MRLVPGEPEPCACCWRMQETARRWERMPVSSAHTDARARAHTHGGSRELVTGAEQMKPGLPSLYQLLPELC